MSIVDRTGERVELPPDAHDARRQLRDWCNQSRRHAAAYDCLTLKHLNARSDQEIGRLVYRKPSIVRSEMSWLVGEIRSRFSPWHPDVLDASDVT